MSYNIVDMMWIGKLGSKSVAAIGAAGLFVWLGNAIMLVPKIGAEISISQAFGKKDTKSMEAYKRNAILVATTLSILYAILLFTFSKNILGFFGFSEVEVIKNGATYLRWIAPGMLFVFLNPTFTGIYNGQGNSRFPFRFIAAGFILNLILDPLLIFGIGFFPRMETSGAALASVLSQMVVCLLFLKSFKLRIIKPSI